MAITPNTTFVTGDVFTAQQANNFPRGIMATATSTTAYTLTTSYAIATGMTVTFTALANRNYRITYIEPQAGTPSVSGGYSASQIKITNASGTQLQQGLVQTGSAVTVNGVLALTYVGTLTAGSITIVGCGITSSTTGAPAFARSAGTAVAQLTVEDIGTA